MADGITLNADKVTLNTKSLEGIGLTPKEDDTKKLFKKDDQSELMQAIKDMPESFRQVLKETLQATGQSIVNEIFANEPKTQEEPKEHFQKPTDKINDVKKLTAKYGTPALYLGSKIDDIIKILSTPVKEIATSTNNPISAAGVIVLGSNVENSKKYIKDFQELTNFVSSQKPIDLGVFKDTQKRLDELTESMDKTTHTKVKTKDSEKFTKQMSSITANFGQVVKQVISLNALTSFINFKKANAKLDDMDKYLERLSGIGDNIDNFATNLALAASCINESMKAIIKSSLISKLAISSVKSIKNFFTKGIQPLIDTLEEMKLPKIKSLAKLMESIKDIAVDTLITCKTFATNLVLAASYINESMRAIIKSSLISKLAINSATNIKNFFTNGIQPLIDTLEDMELSKIKSLAKSMESIKDIAMNTLITCKTFAIITPFAVLGKFGAMAAKFFVNELAIFLDLVSDKFDLKRIQKNTRAIKAIVLLVTLTSASMVITSLVTPIAVKALMGAAALGLFAVGMTFALNLMGKMTGKIALGLLAATLTTVFAGLAFIALKALSTITPKMVGVAMIAILGFVGIMAVAALLGTAATVALAPLALGTVAAILTTTFALTAFLAVKTLTMINPTDVQHAVNIISGGDDGPGLINLFIAAMPLALVGPVALVAMATSMPAALMMAAFAVGSKVAIDALSSIDQESIKTSAKNITLMAIPFAATAVAAIAAVAAMASLPPILGAITMLAMVALPFKAITNILGKEPLFTEKNPAAAKTGILGFVNVMTYTVSLLSLTAALGPLAILGASLISVVLLALTPALLAFSSVSKFFNKKANPNLVDTIYGDNLSKPLKSKYGLIPFLAGAVIAAKTLVGGTIHFLLGTISATLMSFFFSTLKKSLDAMEQLSELSKNGVDTEAVINYLNTMEMVAKKARSPGLLASVHEAAASWVADKMGTTVSDLIDRMSESVGPMRRLSDQLKGINLDGISIFLEALNKIQSMKASPNTKAIKNAIAGVNELTSQIDTIDGNNFNANIESIMPGIERLQNLPEGDGLNKKAKEIKTAITTLFNVKINKNADDMINKVDRLTNALERFSKIDSSSIAKTLGIEGSLNFRETSSSTLGTETKRNTSTTNINIDNSNLEAMLERILNAIESLKEGKTWTDQEASVLG